MIFAFFAILLILCVGAILSAGGFFKQQPGSSPHMINSVTPQPIYHTLDMAVINDTIPVNMQPGQKFDASVIVHNTGDTPWSNSIQIMMTPVDNAANDALSFNNSTFTIPPGITVTNGMNYTWGIHMVAPQWIGNYTIMYQMVDANKTPFGGTFIKNVVVGDSNTSTKFVSKPPQYYPTMSTSIGMKSDSWFNVSISIQNLGRYNWTERDHFRLATIDYERNDATRFYQATEFHIAPDDVIQPGEIATWKFKLHAPPGTTGTYYIKYRMQKDTQWFGSTLNATVTVT